MYRKEENLSSRRFLNSNVMKNCEIYSLRQNVAQHTTAAELKITLLMLYSSLVILLSKVWCTYGHVLKKEAHVWLRKLEDVIKVLADWAAQTSWILVPFLTATLIVAISWLVIYMDSAVPGVTPPTPLSPLPYRAASGHSVHSGYAVAIIGGVIIFVLMLVNWSI